MTSAPSHSSPQLNDDDKAKLLLQLRRKEGNWVQWAQACQTLQKAGLKPQEIFEETGFEPIHQNQIVVALQVYQSVVNANIDQATHAHFTQRGSDLLYELRVLSQADRAKTASFALQHGIDSETVKDLVKPIKEYAYQKEPPEGFTDQPGDALAYHFWRLARQQADLQERSRLIAQGLRFVHSSGARQRLEQLLTDFSVVKARPAPRLPLYRLETDSDLPHLLPVAGELPLTVEDVKAVPLTEAEGPFGIVKFSGAGAWVAIPGWQVILQAENPVGILACLSNLPNCPTDAPAEQVLLVIDRSQRDWDGDGYFLIDRTGQATITWQETSIAEPILGRLILVLRPKRILDEAYNRELWQIDE